MSEVQAGEAIEVDQESCAAQNTPDATQAPPLFCRPKVSSTALAPYQDSNCAA
jgi:hypothetical protein